MITVCAIDHRLRHLCCLIHTGQNRSLRVQTIGRGNRSLLVFTKLRTGQKGLFLKNVVFVLGQNGFRPSVEVMCDAYTLAGEPILTNKTCVAAEIFSNQKSKRRFHA